jgi:tetratricopeptide (TPR) repeat protein
VWALLATVIASLFIVIPSATIPFVATKTFLLAAGALITLALFILARLSRGNAIFPPRLLIGALWLPVVAYALSAAFSGVMFSTAFWGVSLESDTLGFMLVAAILGTLAALVLRRPENYRTFLRASAIVFCAAVALEVLILVIGQFAPNTVSPALSLVGSYEDLAFLLGLGVVSTLIALRFLEIQGRARRFLIGGVVGALVLLAVANSSLVWTLLALVSLGLFVESVMRRSTSSSNSDLDDVGDVQMSAPVEVAESGHRSLVLPLGILAVSLFFLIGGSLGQALASSLHANVISVRPSWQSTLAVAQKTYASSPVFGSGPTTFGSQWLKNRDVSLNSTIFWNANFSSGIGFLPTSFVTTGIIGLLAWLAFLGLLVVLGLRTLIQRAPKDNYIRAISILSFVAAVYLFTVSIFGLPSAALLTLAFVFTGLFVSTTRFAEGGAQWGIIFSRSPRIGFVIVFSLTLVLLGSVVAAYSLVGHYLAVAELTAANATLSTSNNLDGAEKAAQSSIAFAPNATAYQIVASIANARLNQITSNTSLSASVAQQQFQKALSDGINAALTATRLAPEDFQSWVILGNLYSQAVPLGVSGSYESAKTAYEKSMALNPTNPQIPFILAQLNVANKNVKAAIENLKTAITLKQDYPQAIFLLSQLEVQQGNLQDALTAATATAYFTPNDPGVLFQVGILRAASNDLPGAIAALSAAVDASANKQFANASYFLAAVYAKQGDLKNALAQIQIISDLSADNAKAVAPTIEALKAGKNPFPANLLTITPVPQQ